MEQPEPPLTTSQFMLQQIRKGREARRCEDVDSSTYAKIPIEACKGRTGDIGKTFHGKLTYDTGIISISCIEEMLFKLDISIKHIRGLMCIPTDDGLIEECLGVTRVPVPPKACQGFTGAKGKTFSGYFDYDSGIIRVDCEEDLPFWLEIDIGKIQGVQWFKCIGVGRFSPELNNTK